MLERIGGECAGAVTFLPAGHALPATENRYRKLSAGELAAILKELPPASPGRRGGDTVISRRRASIAALSKVETAHEVGEKVGALIRQRAERVLNTFKN